MGGKGRVLTVVMVIGMMCVLPSLVLSAEKDQGVPNMIGLATHPSGSKAYAVTSGMGNAIQKKTGITVRVVPMGTGKSRAMAIAAGESLLAFQTEANSYTQQSGIWDLLAEGPQELSIAWNGYPANVTLFWKGDSGIKRFADIKGKRVANMADYDPGLNMLATGLLAFAGLTWKDVRPYTTTYAAGMQAVLDGTVDVAMCNAAAPKVYEVGASAGGVALADIPAADVEGWKRVKSVCPIVAPGKVTVGYGAGNEKPKEWFTYPMYYVCRLGADERLIYTVAKGIIEGYDLYKDSHPEAREWTLQQAVDLGELQATSLPYHPGTIRALKEAGAWTTTHDRWQQTRIEFVSRIKRAYQEAKDEASTKGVKIGTSDFEKLWLPKWQKIRSDLALIKF